MVAVANKQQFKVKVYKKQIEEAGDIKGGMRRSMAIFALNTL